MSIESAIEEMIKQAMARGEFDNLAGKGRPVDLDAYFNTPEDMRMAFAMLKSNNFVPDEVEKLGEIARLKEATAASRDEAETLALTKKLNELTLTVTLMLENRKRKR